MPKWFRQERTTFPWLRNETNAIHAGETKLLTIPAGSLGTYSATGPIPGNGRKDSTRKAGLRVELRRHSCSRSAQMFFKIHAGVSAAEAEARMAHERSRSRPERSLA